MNKIVILIIAIVCAFIISLKGQNGNRSLDQFNSKNNNSKQFKRWKSYISPRVNLDGTFSSKDMIDGILDASSSTSREYTYGDWKYIGPTQIPYYNNNNVPTGSGRLDCIAFHPADTNIIWVGAHAGGLWKTIDGGINWYTTTDDLPSIGISDIVLHPTNPDIIYLTTGDRDSWFSLSIGLYKSIDGGENWEETGLIYNLNYQQSISELIINPENPDIMYVATESGIYKSIDGADNWYMTKSGHFKEIAMKEDDPQVLFASTYNMFGGSSMYKSNDAGETFIKLSDVGFSSSNICRTTITTTPSNPDLIYVMTATKSPGFNLDGIYKSIDGGLSWDKILDGNNYNLIGRSRDGQSMDGLGWYTLSLAVSPVDENEIWVGCVNLWKSTNGGLDWEIKAHEYGETFYTDLNFLWPDVHELKFRPNSSILYIANDAGLTKTYNKGDDLIDLSDDLQIMQVYELAVSQIDETKSFCGIQDQSGMYKNGDNWTSFYCGESGENFFDIEDPSTLYVSGYQYGLRRFTNNGASFVDITPDPFNSYSAVWLQAFKAHPTNPNTIFVGYNALLKSENRGDSWTQISNNLSNDRITILAISNSNPDFMIASDEVKTWKSVDGGYNWVRFDNNWPNLRLTDIYIHPENTEILWACFGGYSSTRKVYKSENGGQSWQNMTLNLPNIHMNSLQFDFKHGEGVYIGTEVGVYYYHENLGEWIPFTNGLPNAIVNDMEIQAEANVLRAGTFGRGLWESPLINPLYLASNNLNRSYVKVFPNPAFDNIGIIGHTTSDSYLYIRVFSTNGKLAKEYNIKGMDVSARQIRLDVSDLIPGIYFLNIMGEKTNINHKIIIQ